MGAACCRCQQVPFDDAVLRFAAVSDRSTQLQLQQQQPLRQSQEQLAQPSALRRVASHPSSSRPHPARHPPRRHRSARLERRRPTPPMSGHHALTNYVSFPFPFAGKLRLRRDHGGKRDAVQRATATQEPESEAVMERRARRRALLASQGLGDHSSVTDDGTMSPLTLVEACVRRIAAQLVHDPQSILHRPPVEVTLPSDLATAILQWLKRHDALRKEHFRFLARFLQHEWGLADCLQVQSDWFDELPVTPLQHLRSLDFRNCQHLESLGIDRWLHVDELPSLQVATFDGCTRLSKCVPDVLQSSTRLTSLTLAGCRNIDDRSLLALRRLFRLRHLNLDGCTQVTDSGFKCLTGLSKMESLVISRCLQITDDAFEDLEIAFPKLRRLDVAHCRITDVGLAHIAHLTGLTSLVIRGCRQVGDIGVERLYTLSLLQHFDARHCEEVRTLRPEWTKLQVVLLTRTAFAEAEASVLKHMKEIVELDLQSCRILKRGFEFVSKLQHLRKLNLAETALTDMGLLQLCKQLSCLEWLDISHTEITDEGTDGFCNLKSLQVLRMDTTGISNRALANVGCVTSLRELDLFGASITDSGLPHLVGLHQLVRLEICTGTITDRGVESISHMNHLQLLNVSQNRNLTVKSLLSLQALKELRHLNLSNTGISAVSLRHLYPLKKLESLSVYGCDVSPIQVEMLQEILPELRCLRCA